MDATTRISRGSLTALAGAVGALVLVAGAAWACTSSASLSASPSYGPPGTRVTVTGSSFTNGEIEIRWNGLAGTRLAVAPGPNFSVLVTIPSAAPDNYVILAVGRDASGNLWQKSTPFEVTTGSASSTGPTRPTSSTPTGTSGSTSGSTSGTTSGQTSSGQTGGPTTAATNDQSAPASTTEGSTAGSPASSDAGGRTSSSAEPASAERSTSATTDAGAGGGSTGDGRPRSTGGAAGATTRFQPEARSVVTPGAAGVPGVAPPAGAVAAPAGPTPTDAGTDEAVPVVSHRSAVADAWSGFGTSPATSRGAGLLEPVVRAPGDGRLPAAGVVLVSLGLVALTGGSALAGIRRRRAVAS